MTDSLAIDRAGDVVGVIGFNGCSHNPKILFGAAGLAHLQ